MSTINRSNINTMTTHADVLLSTNFDINRYEMDEMIAICTFGRLMRATYEQFLVEEPDQFSRNLKAVERGIRAANEDRREREVKLIDAELDAMKSKNDKREELMARRAKLTGQGQSA